MGKEKRTGTFVKNRRGFGFVELPDRKEDDKDIYVAPADQKGAMNGDIVTVDLIPQMYWDGTRPEGIITKIEKRAVTEITGTFFVRRKFGVVLPANEKDGIPVSINLKETSGAKNGDRVVAKITKYPEKGQNAQGKITSVLALKDDPYGDIKALIRSKGLFFTFPSKSQAQASAIAKAGISDEEKAGREDLRHKNIFTIDGADSKDFDDAVSIEKSEKGNYILGVHIADVAHYVTEESPLDKEALKRGNSVYVINQVVPMLPKELSNGLCSLNEGVDRLALSCEMEVTPAGDVIDHRIFESVICSKHRLIYDDVSDIMEDNNKLLIEKYRDISNDLMVMKELFEILSEKRTKRGSIDFDVDEAYIVLGPDGIPVDVRLASRRTANRVIEEFMLLANQTVAEHFYWLSMPFIYRVHEKPEAKKMVELKQFLSRLSIPFKADPANVHPKVLAEILEHAADTPYAGIVDTVTLRSMQKAFYSTDCGGHFGLSLTYYTHFTSPIRRYPDLFIHRVIKEHLHGTLTEERMQALAGKAVEAAETSSYTERGAMELERTAEKMKKAQFMEEHVGDYFTGIISGVTKFGLFIELENTIEGLARFAEMTDDFYEVFPEQYKAVGERTRNIYELGDPVRIKVISANRYTGEIDFAIAYNKDRNKRKNKKRRR